MENKEQNVVENTTKVEKESIKNNTLIRKTKAQLIEIILRKDDVERKLRNELNDMTDKYTSSCNTNNIISDKNYQLKKEINETNNIYSTLITKYISKLDTRNNIIIVLSIILLVSIVIYIISFIL